MATIVQGRAALIINECQRGVIEPELAAFGGLAEQAAARGIVPRIAKLAEAFRAAGLPVLHAPAAHRPDLADVPANTLITSLVRKTRGMIAGTAETEFVPELAPHASDFVIHRTSGMIVFLGTTLDYTLRRLGVSTVVMTGVSTNLAIAGCSIAASDMGYHVVIAEDCIAGSDPATHDVIVREQLRMIARISTADEVAGAL